MLRPCKPAGIELSYPKKRSCMCCRCQRWMGGVRAGWMGPPKSFRAKNSIRSFRHQTLDPEDLECALLGFEFICI